MAVIASMWETIAREASQESPLWAAALLPSAERDETPVFSALAEERFALAVETIYEGYLLHYGRPRLFARVDEESAVLLGDYLYAHGLVRLSGNVEAVSDLAELISLCTQLRAEASGIPPDGVVWAATAALLGGGNGGLERARAALRVGSDTEPLRAAAAAAAGEAALARALAAHSERVE